MFLPTTKEEADALGWERFDVILITGDTYIDHPFMGMAVIGRVLMDRGFRVGIIAQPDISDNADISRLGEPLLFWGVTSGSVDSMVSNYNADRSRRRHDDLTPGGDNDRRPDRALIAYTGLIRRSFKNTVPIVLGGIEASLRRISHYDYWQDQVRRSVLFDAKADILVYGMAENSIAELAGALKNSEDFSSIDGICYIAGSPGQDCIELPSFEEVSSDDTAFEKMFHLFYRNSDPVSGRCLVQKHGNRYLVQNRPAKPLSVDDLDRVNELPYERDAHPYYGKQGEVRALDTIRFSITSHRGCFGGCNFCSIAVHQGRTIVSRSEDSILREAGEMVRHSRFRGIINDLGGATANMYGMDCAVMKKGGFCTGRRCLDEERCSRLDIGHARQLELLRKIRTIKGIKKVFIASGIRYDLIVDDTRYGREYLNEIVRHHLSGQMRIAPEHVEDRVLHLMGKPSVRRLKDFIAMFREATQNMEKKPVLTHYLMAAHPGCSGDDMAKMNRILSGELKDIPGQVQIFTPTPSTYSTLMYYTGRDPFNGNELFVERDMGKKVKQKNTVQPRRL